MERKKSFKKRIILLLVILAVFVAVFAIATPTIACYVKQINQKNMFIPAQPSTAIEVRFSDKNEMNIAVLGYDYPVYVRVAIIINWQTDDGLVYSTAPEDTDYVIDLNDNEKEWVKKGEFYYYIAPVYTNGETSVLIKSFSQSEGANVPDGGYSLSVEVIAQAVQAVGFTDGGEEAWLDAWKGFPKA